MPRGLTQPTKDLIAAAAILAEIQPTTVRGVAYQFFNRKMVPDMSRASVKRVSRLLTLARERGDIPWEWIVDETRPVELRNSWKDPDRYMRAVGRGYRKDRWDDQPRQVMVVSEKSTVGGVIRPITDKYGVPFQVLHGWGSSTALHDLAERSAAADRLLVVLYVGDHDPSGRYMSDVDLEKRTDKYGGCVYVERVAVDEDHIWSTGCRPSPRAQRRTTPAIRGSSRSTARRAASSTR